MVSKCRFVLVLITCGVCSREDVMTDDQQHVRLSPMLVSLELKRNVKVARRSHFSSGVLLFREAIERWALSLSF